VHVIKTQPDSKMTEKFEYNTADGKRFALKIIDDEQIRFFDNSGKEFLRVKNNPEKRIEAGPDYIGRQVIELFRGSGFSTEEALRGKIDHWARSNKGMVLGIPTGLQVLKDKVVSERQGAKREARTETSWPVIASRGTFLCTSDGIGQCSPMPEAEEIKWRGSKRQIETVVRDVMDHYPECKEVYIAGGFDGGDSPQAIRQDWLGEVDRWISAWNVTVWTREEGYLFW